MDSQAVGWVILAGLLIGAFMLGKKWNGGYRMAIAYRLQLEQQLSAEAQARATAEARMAVGQSVIVNQGGAEDARLDRVEGAAAAVDAGRGAAGSFGWVVPGELGSDPRGTLVPGHLAVEGVPVSAPAAAERDS